MAVKANWMFLSNHAHVLICLARNSDQPLREVASAVGITERAIQRIVAELEAEGYLSRERSGRRNRYLLYRDRPLRHPLAANATLGDLLEIFVPRASGETADDLTSFTHWRVGEHGSEI